ncbi:hypothetical protein COOONC_12080 [Cooperia oncophora]
MSKLSGSERSCTFASEDCPCPLRDRCESSNRIMCANGGVPNPRQCDECLCPHGYGGRFCEERPSGCGETLEAAPYWKTKTFTFDNTSLVSNRDYTICNHWIKVSSLSTQNNTDFPFDPSHLLELRGKSMYEDVIYLMLFYRGDASVD